jgi:hypothetical protein
MTTPTPFAGFPIPPTSPFRDAIDADSYLVESWFALYQPDVDLTTVYNSVGWWVNQIASHGVSGAFWLFMGTSGVVPIQAERASILANAPKSP